MGDGPRRASDRLIYLLTIIEPVERKVITWVHFTRQKRFDQLVSSEATSEILFSHRWRYAFTESPLGQPCLWDAELSLGVCGDWCLGRRVEDAWQSGADLAVRMLKHFEEEKA